MYPTRLYVSLYANGSPIADLRHWNCSRKFLNGSLPGPLFRSPGFAYLVNGMQRVFCHSRSSSGVGMILVYCSCRRMGKISSEKGFDSSQELQEWLLRRYFE